MRIRLLTDNVDAYTGLRLAGAVCTMVERDDDFADALDTALADQTAAVLLITQGLYDRNRALADDAKRRVAVPLITEIPDTSGDFDTDAIARYVIDAIGAG